MKDVVVTKEAVIKSKHGLHARVAMKISTLSGLCDSDVTIVDTETGRKARGDSILSLTALCLPKGSRIKIQCSGSDASTVIDSLVKIVETFDPD